LVRVHRAPTRSGFLLAEIGAIIGHARPEPTENNPRRDARFRRPWSPDLLLGLSLQPISGDRWPDDVRLSDLEPRFTCQACGRRGADVRPDWQSAEAYA